MLYYEFVVGEKTYKCVLTASSAVQVERKLGMNPLTMLSRLSDNDLPSLESMLIILWGSLQKYEHGISMEDTYDIYDKYVESGKQFTDLVTEVVNIMEVSGFFKRGDAEAKNSKKEKKKA